MVVTVRCFKCGEDEARLVMGGREIMQARCEACSSNLLAEVLELEERTIHERIARRERHDTMELEQLSEGERPGCVD
jgi:hypothetical protein